VLGENEGVLCYLNFYWSFFQMTLCYVLQHDSNLKNCQSLPVNGLEIMKCNLVINKCASLVVRGEVSRFLYNSNPTFYFSSQEFKSYLKRIAIPT